MKSVTFVRGWVKMLDSSSDDDKKKIALIRFYMGLIFLQRKENGDYNHLVR